MVEGGIRPIQNISEHEIAAAEMLTDFCFDWRLLGTLYLCDALAMVLKEGEGYLAQPITKAILPEIAARRNTSWQAAERSMRYAIESAWLRAFPELIQAYFPRDYPKCGRPSVAQFIHTIGRALLQSYAQNSAQRFNNFGKVK